jgi:cytoskeletal protein CcmA (bactofilin family)
MASNVTIIGRSARVRGRIGAAGDNDLQILGFVEGEISVGGDVTIEAGGMVGAGVTGRKLVVRGAVKGDLNGEESVLLEDGARVVGDVRAPRVAIAPGALVRGYVDTGNTAAPARAARTQPAAAHRPAATPAHSALAGQAAKTAAPAHRPAAAPVASGVRALAGTRAAESAHSAAGQAADKPARRPPPPVVPVLKKAKGQMAKKKER